MKYILIIALLFAGSTAKAQSIPPKYEFRGAWVATVNNIDWPSRSGLSVDVQKREATDMLDMLRKLGFNAVIFQGRPTADAFYPSSLEPWSRYLTGAQGGDPGYDPLAFWISECHNRGMEFHLWCNPYRIAQHADEPLAANHVAFRHPEWVITYGGKLYFNPGIPETRNFIAQVIKDVVTRYDIDAIHFDDYFYPYPVGGEAFPDLVTFARYPGAFANGRIEDWRRENVNMTIRLLSETIKKVKPWVKFGVSPFGVWRNKSDDVRGSMTMAGVTSYDHLYADILNWAYQGWIDYIIPQIYWEIGHPAADFRVLCHWWNDNNFGKALYIGQALYKSEADSKTIAWRNPGQLTRQIQLTRQTNGIQGSAFFSAKHFKRNPMGLQDSLANNHYATKAIIPPMTWVDGTSPDKPLRVRKNGRIIKWKTKKTDDPMNAPVRFIIYKTKKDEPLNPDDPRSILLITASQAIILEKSDGKKEKFLFRVSALDRLNNESEMSRTIRVRW